MGAKFAIRGLQTKKLQNAVVFLKRIVNYSQKLDFALPTLSKPIVNTLVVSHY